MKILITNNALMYRSGSELYVQELAFALRDRGHEVAAFSTDLGDLAQKMIDGGIIVIDDLEKLPWKPDIIHAQHHLETMIALTYFPHTPAVYVCHGWKPWQEIPPLHPRIVTYVAVDTKTRDQAITEHHIPADNIHIMHNFVDLHRFKERENLPLKPKKALVFSNYASENNFLPCIREACNKADITLDVVGMSSGHVVEDPENIIRSYDLIFAVGRSALEALASGVSVVICGVWGVGPLVTFKDVDRLRDLNFGVAAMYTELDADVIYKEICRYDADDAKRVTQYLRERIGLDHAVDDLEKLYSNVLKVYDSMQGDTEGDSRAHAKYLKKIAILLKQNIQECAVVQGGLQHRELLIQQKDCEIMQKNNEIAMMQASKFWKMRDIYMRFKNIVKRN